MADKSAFDAAVDVDDDDGEKTEPDADILSQIVLDEDGLDVAPCNYPN